MSSFIRRKVSQNRIRLENDGYDLDLTYICDNMIAMGLPAESFLQSVARNPLDKVARYLKEKHGGYYKIYNLLMKPNYNYSQFDNMVESFPMPDHYPPNFLQIEDFCKNVHNWLSQNRENVAVVHCKAGKGRTGTMISCYFIYARKYSNPYDAMDYFSSKRCIDGKGVTIPSQKRYIEYFADYLLKKQPYKEIDLYLKQIDIHLPNNSFFNTLSFQLFKEHSIKIYDSEGRKLSLKNETISWHLRTPIRLNGDIKISFSNKNFRNKQNMPVSTNDKSCVGTVIAENNNSIKWTLFKKEIDVAHKDKRFSPEMKLIFHFDQNASSSSLSSSNCNAFENLHITDDDGFYAKINHDKRTTNSAIISQNHKPSISRSDSYVTPQAVVFDESNQTNYSSNADTKEKSILDRFNNKPKLETKKILLTVQSHTSSECSANSDSEISSQSQVNDNMLMQNTLIEALKNNVQQETIISSSSIEPEEKLKKCEKSGSLKETNKKKKILFFKKKSFFSLKKNTKLNKKYKRQRNNSSNHNDTLEDQSYDLLSNSSNNKASSTNELNAETQVKNGSSSSSNNNKMKKLSDDNNDYDEVYDDDDDDDEINVKKDSLKVKNLKQNFFTRLKPN